MLIRPAHADDFDQLLNVVHTAFTTDDSLIAPGEVALTRNLLQSSFYIDSLALVAQWSREADIVGIVVGTKATVGAEPAVGIGPLAVRPNEQSHGVGTALMHAQLSAIDSLGYPLVALLGDTGYYARFGFSAAHTLDVRAPTEQWGDHFQARRMHTWTTAAVGDFTYAAPFNEA